LSESNLDHSVRVTAEQRPHPALRKLARACIALALLQLGGKPPTAQPPAAANIQPAEQPNEEATASGREGRHG
jgi:hypothetical protein